MPYSKKKINLMGGDDDCDCGTPILMGMGALVGIGFVCVLPAFLLHTNLANNSKF